MIDASWAVGEATGDTGVTSRGVGNVAGCGVAEEAGAMGVPLQATRAQTVRIKMIRLIVAYSHTEVEIEKRPTLPEIPKAEGNEGQPAGAADDSSIEREPTHQ
jgi:hypothetical protein